VEYFVEIRLYETDEVEKTLGPFPNERMADKADRGLNINLNHDLYYTLVSSPQPTVPSPTNESP
jgi:hypothetical protein